MIATIRPPVPRRTIRTATTRKLFFLNSSFKRLRKKEQSRRENKQRKKRNVKQRRILRVSYVEILFSFLLEALSRRWDDDVVFKNQARDEPKLKKRFVNDTIRNDFHRRF